MSVADPIGAVLGFFSPRRARERVLESLRLRHVRDYAKRGYDAAKPGNRWGGWRGTSGSANTEISAGHDRLKARARDLVRNDPHARRALAILVSNIVGTGIVMRSATGQPALDEKIDALFKAFGSRADADGDLTLDGLIALAVRSTIEGGDCLIRRRWRRSTDRLPVPMQLQVIEGDLLDTTINGPGAGGLTWRLGIGFDPLDRRQAYRIFRQHPGEFLPGAGAVFTSSEVAAADVLHVFMKERPGQIRGASWFAPVIAMLRDKGDFQEASLVKKRTESLFGVAITSAEAGDGTPPLSGQTNAATKSSDDPLVEDLYPGMAMRLKPGESLTSFAPSAVAGDLDAFMLHTLMSVAVGMGVTYDQLAGDMRQANYSSLRAAKIEIRRLVEQLQWHWVIPKICMGLWDWFIEAAIAAGDLEPRDGGYPAEATPPAHEPIDPKLEQEADYFAVQTHRMTLKQYVEKWGYPFAAQIKEQRAALDALNAAGLTLPPMPGQGAKPDATTKP